MDNTTSDKTLAGYSAEHPTAITKYEGDIGACVEFSTTEYLCAKLKMRGFFDPKMTSIASDQGPGLSEKDKKAFLDSGCSGLDLMIKTFDENRKDPARTKCKTFADFHRPSQQQNATASVEERNEYACFARDEKHAIEIAQTEGMCPESYMPSDFLKLTSDNSAAKNELQYHDELQGIYERLQSRQSSEAAVPLTGFCASCSTDTGITTKTMKSDAILKATGEGTSNFDLLLKINELACPKNIRMAVANELKKINFKTIVAKSGDDFELTKIFEKNDIALMSIDARTLWPGIAAKNYSPDNQNEYRHAVVAYAPIYYHPNNYKNEQKLDKCSVVVSTSWGMACTAFEGEMQKMFAEKKFDLKGMSLLDPDGSPVMSCDKNKSGVETGSFIVSSLNLSSHNTEIIYDASVDQ